MTIHTLEWDKIAGIIGSSLSSLGKTYPNLLMPEGGLIISGVGEFIKGMSGLKQSFIEKGVIDKLDTPREKAFILIFISYFDALNQLLEENKENIAHFKDNKKNLSKKQDSLLKEYLTSIRSKKYSLLDFDETYPENSEIYKNLNNICDIIFSDMEFCNNVAINGIIQEKIHKKFKDTYIDVKSKKAFKEAADYINNLIRTKGPERLIEKLRQRALSLGSSLVYKDFVLDQIFVEPQYGIHKFDGRNFSKEPQWQDEDIIKGVEKIFNGGKNVCFITAPMGMGKSSFSKIYASKVAMEGERIPIFIELKSFYPRTVDGNSLNITIYALIKEYIKRELDIYDFEDKTFDNLLLRNSFLIIFDGIDEIPDIGVGNKEVTKVIDYLSKIEGKDIRVIITSRPAVLSLKVHENINDEEYPLISIKEFNDAKIDQWLKNWFNRAQNKGIPKKYHIQLGHVRDERLKEDISTPLILYMLTKILYGEDKYIDPKEAFQGDGIKSIDIYQRFIDWTVKNAKYHMEKIPRKKMPKNYRMLLGEVAYGIFAQSRGEQITEEDFKKRMAKSVEDAYLKLESTHCIALAYFEHHEKYGKTTLEGIKKEGHFEFQHKSFKEYLTAERILSIFLRASFLESKETQDQYQYLIGDNFPTQEILNFIYGLINQLIEVSNYTQKAIQESIINKEGIPWRFSQIMGNIDPENFEDIGKKVFNIAFRWMQNENPFIPKYLSDEINIEGQTVLRCKDYIHFSKNSQAISFLIAAHMSRKKFKDAHFGKGLWLRNLLSTGLSVSTRNDVLRKNLYGLNLERAILLNVDLSFADLEGSNLSKADLSMANLGNADLVGADLKDADLEYADLREAYLYDFYDVDYEIVSLKGANLKDAKFMEKDVKILKNQYGVDFSKAKIYSLK